MIKAILFDKDGTLFDFQKTWGGWAATHLRDLANGDDGLMRALAARIRFDPDTQLFHADSPVIAGTPEEGVELIHPLLPEWEFDALLAHSNATAARAPLAEVLPLAPYLDGLRDYGLGVATNDSESSARAHLRAVEVEGHFDHIIGSDSGYGGKPGAGMCLGFATRISLPPETIAMVGDSLHDLHAGRAAGMVCIGVLTGVAERDELEPHADVVLDDIGAIPDWLTRILG